MVQQERVERSTARRRSGGGDDDESASHSPGGDARKRVADLVADTDRTVGAVDAVLDGG